jgi:hypothetical protein
VPVPVKAFSGFTLCDLQFRRSRECCIQDFRNNLEDGDTDNVRKVLKEKIEPVDETEYQVNGDETSGDDEAGDDEYKTRRFRSKWRTASPSAAPTNAPAPCVDEGVINSMTFDHSQMLSWSPFHQECALPHGKLTALMVAAGRDWSEMAKVLHNYGAHVNAESNNDNDGAERTPVMIASKCGNQNMVKLLLGWGAHVDKSDIEIAHRHRHPVRTFNVLFAKHTKEQEDKEESFKKELKELQNESKKLQNESKNLRNESKRKNPRNESKENTWPVTAGFRVALFVLAVAAWFLSQHKGVSFYPHTPDVPYNPVAPGVPQLPESPDADVPMASPVGREDEAPIGVAGLQAAGLVKLTSEWGGGYGT